MGVSQKAPVSQQRGAAHGCCTQLRHTGKQALTSFVRMAEHGNALFAWIAALEQRFSPLIVCSSYHVLAVILELRCIASRSSLKQDLYAS